MQTHLISIKILDDENETYSYFCSNYNRLDEEPIYGIIFGNSKSGIYLNRDKSLNQTFKYDISLITEYTNVSYIEYMLNYFPYDLKEVKHNKHNIYNTLNIILENKRWDDISTKLFKKS